MGFALTTIGLIMIVVGAKGTHREFSAQLVSDFTGPKNFLYWIAALGAVGALGYIDSLRTFSHYFMALIIIAIFLANQGFFDKFSQALKSGPITITPSAPTTAPQQKTENNGFNIGNVFSTGTKAIPYILPLI